MQQLDEGANSAYGSGRFEDAVRLATGTLALDPSTWDALRTRAKAQFALAHFTEAARDDLSLINVKLKNKNSLDTPLSVLITNYTDALGSGTDAHRGWIEFGQLVPILKSQAPEVATQADVELAGLALVGGNAAQAKELLARAHDETTQAVAPEALARLGWWYYRAQNPEGAQDVLAEIVRLRPGDEEMRNYQGWTALELQSSQFAMSFFQQVSWDAQPDMLLDNGPQMGIAVARWRLGQRDPALAAFESAVNSKPQWMNRAWVSAIYSPGVARTVDEMAGEYKKRQNARRRP